MRRRRRRRGGDRCRRNPVEARKALVEIRFAFGRDLVNTPANDLGPDALEREALDVAERFGAKGSTLTEKDISKLRAAE